MKTFILSATLAASTVSALPQFFSKLPGGSNLPNIASVSSLESLTEGITDFVEDVIAPALPLHLFDTPKLFQPLTPEDLANRVFVQNTSATHEPAQQSFAQSDFAAAATCSNPRVRVEWDRASNANRQAYIDAIKCLHSKPSSGQFSQAKNRYEDLAALHQTLTPNVHGNAKFLVWHRYYTWAFEDILRSECGFTGPMLWFDETRYAGRFAQSSIFSSQWYGSVNVGGNCVTDGQFANLALNVGPGSGNSLHCLARNNDDSKTQYCSSQMVDGCNNENDYSNMATCAERGAHAWGHNGVGAVMQDTAGAPEDPFFFLHHAFIDRNLRIWQNKDSARIRSINGNDKSGNPLTLDTTINIYGMRPDVRIRDVLDTTGTTLCYKYDY